MSDSWQHARGLAKQLQRELPEDSEIGNELRARLEQVVADALHARARSKRLRWFGVGGAGVVGVGLAAAVLLALHDPTSRGSNQGVLAKRESPPAVLEGTLSFERAGASGTALGAGAVVSMDAGTMLRSGPTTTLSIAPTASLELRDAVLRVESFGKTAAFVLDTGVVGVDAVADARRFSVRTIDATASGDHARFDVSSAGSECGRTRIVVRRGVVSVRTARGVEAVGSGNAWSDCEHTVAPVTATSATVVASLDQQNDALTVAVTARREGRTDEALQAYTRFLRRWPHGPLSEVARADRMNLLATRDPDEAARAAREYLRFHPTGPAAPRALELSKKGSK